MAWKAMVPEEEARSQTKGRFFWRGRRGGGGDPGSRIGGTRERLAERREEASVPVRRGQGRNGRVDSAGERKGSSRRVEDQIPSPRQRGSGRRPQGRPWGTPGPDVGAGPPGAGPGGGGAQVARPGRRPPPPPAGQPAGRGVTLKGQGYWGRDKRSGRAVAKNSLGEEASGVS